MRDSYNNIRNFITFNQVILILVLIFIKLLLIKSRHIFGELVDFITSGPIVALALQADGAVAGVREMMGKTNPLDSAPGTIRGDLALLLAENVIHGSDSVESAERELAIYFPDGLL